MAMEIEPEQDHQREKVTEMKRGSGWVDAGIDADLFGAEELLEDIAVTIR